MTVFLTIFSSLILPIIQALWPAILAAVTAPNTGQISKPDPTTSQDWNDAFDNLAHPKPAP